ncbi:MAG: SpoIIE family protein phosphatase [Gemmiger sp.]
MPNEIREIHTAPQGRTAGLRPVALAWQAAAAAVGFAMGAGRVYGGAVPFGLALVMGCAPGYTAAAAAGVLVSTVIFLPGIQAAKLAGAVLAVLAARRVTRGNFWAGAGTGAAALVLAQAAAGFGAGFTAADNAALLCTAVLAALLGLGIANWPGAQPKGACLWLAMLTACVQSFSFLSFAPGLALMALVTLSAAFAGTLEQCAVLSVALAAAFAAASPSLCFAALAVALGSLAAALLFPGERRSCVGVFCAGCGFGALAAPSLSGAITLALGAGSGVLIFLCLPVSWLRELFPQAAPPPAPQGLNTAARRLNAVADTLADIAATVDAVCERETAARGETYDFVVDYAARRVCQGCSERSKCWLKGYSNAVDGIYRLKPILENEGKVEVENLPGQLCCCAHPADLCESVTRGYRLWCSRRLNRTRAAQMRSALTEQYGAMAAALGQLAGQLGSTGLRDPRRESRVQQLFASVGLDALECSVTTDAAGRVCAGVTVARTNFTSEELRAVTAEMSRICRRSFSLPDVTNCRTVTLLSFGERPVYRALFGAASRPAEEVSGDVTEQFCDAAGRAQMFLCDGMGTGRAAAVDGQLAARLMGQLLRAGFAAESAARLVNVALGLKSAGQESGATLDLLTVDLYTGRAGLFKAGAAASFLLRGGVPRRMEGASLPMGVTDSVVGRSTSFSLEEGDTVVLVSDGVLCDGTDWVMQQLQLCGELGHTPEQLACVVADAALRRAPARRDDITVLALRLARS